MYVLYEHHQQGSNTVGTDILLSSVFPGVPDLQWFIKSERAHADFLLEAYKRTVNTQSRVFDNDTKIWSFIGPVGKQMLDQLQVLLSGASNLKFVQIDNLVEQTRAGFISENSKSSSFKAEDFYYNPSGASGSPALTKETVIERLTALLETEPLAFEALPAEFRKSVYRKAALKYHPDRNGGDGSKMSELNMLWSIYNA